MLSYGKSIGQISRITKHAYSNYTKSRGFEFITGIGSRRHMSNDEQTNKKKHIKQAGQTLKAEECIPLDKMNKKIREEIPSCPPPSKGSASSNYCPQACEDICGKIPPPKRPSDNNNSNYGKYWKYIVTTIIIISGATIYTYRGKEWLSQITSSHDDDDEKSQIPSNKRKKIINQNEKRQQYPVSSVSIPKEVPYLLIGGGTAAFSAFRSIKSREPKAKVLVITDEPDYPYMRPPLSKELWYNSSEDQKKTSVQNLTFKQWNGTERSLYYEPPEFYTKVETLMDSDKGGVAVATGWRVKSIDAINKIAVLEDGYEIKYDKCLVATGTSPKNLSIFENANDLTKSKVILYRTKDDFLKLEKRLADPSVKNIVIIGGGFLGSELACSLSRNLANAQKYVYQIYKEKFIMSQILPEYLSEWTTKRSIMEGVRCIPNSEIENYEITNGQLNLSLTNGKTVQADQVILAIGVQVNSEFAKVSNLEIDPHTGGFLVNAELEARSNLWVAGDAACFYDVKLGRRRVEHHDHAVISGRLAGENMTGANKPYLHQSMFWSDLGPDVGYEAIGIVDSTLPTVGVFAKFDNNNNDQNKNNANNGKIDNVSITTTTPSFENNNNNNNNNNEKISSQDSCIIDKDKHIPQTEKDYGKGVIFYLKNDTVVGIVLWNIFNRMSLARQVLARETHYEDLNEIAKLFAIHEE